VPSIARRHVGRDFAQQAESLLCSPPRHFRTLGLSVKPEPISEVPGHAVIPELNAVDYQANRPFWRTVQKQLAELASMDVVYRPATGL
jgi:hypothetical protein